jgi:hypothetical protein
MNARKSYAAAPPTPTPRSTWLKPPELVSAIGDTQDPEALRIRGRGA